MAAASSISDIVFLLIQQKRQLAQKSVHHGVYKTLDKMESAKNTLRSSLEEYKSQSLQISKGAVINPNLIDFKGDEFIPFAEQEQTLG